MTSPVLKEMKVVKIHEAKTHLSRLIKEVQKGEEIVIARGNKPVVKLVLVEDTNRRSLFGLFKGQIWMSEDFDAPLEDFDEYQ
ncbi:MAG TPA: type II toxin-antitoxin system Phd/YefM family antitoxin [Kofleriaceae bacterium]